MESTALTSQETHTTVAQLPFDLRDISGRIVEEHTFMAGDAVSQAGSHYALEVLTIHIIVLDDGMTIVGKSTPASFEKFDAEIGAKFAREDAIRQLWLLTGFELYPERAKCRA
ncbi:MAG: Gp49 family protein [Pseudomonadota bacterium]